MRTLLGITLTLCVSGCALTSSVLGQSGTINAMYYAPAWGPNEKGEEVVYFLKQVTLEASAHGENRIYLCSIKPDASERKELAQLWKEQPDQFLEPYATAATMEINTATKRAAIGVEQGRRSGVFVTDLAGKNFKSLWPKEWTGDRPTTAGYPTWSPEGKWIAFHEHRFEKGNDYFRIARMRPDATEYTPLTERDDFNMQPAWSPMGDLIAYVSDQMANRARNIHAVNLWIMNPGGGEKRNTKQWGRYPRWSPDGGLILLDSAEVVDPVSGNQTKRFEPDLPLYPKWGKSGFVFVGPDQIGFTSLDGKTTTRLLRNVVRKGGIGDLDKERFRW